DFVVHLTDQVPREIPDRKLAPLRHPETFASSLSHNYYWTATPSSATGRRHPTVDASISIWMAPGHLCGDSLHWTRVSTTGCRLVDDTALQAERDNAVVAQLPNPALWIPRRTGLLHLR